MKLWYQGLARQAETLDYGADLKTVISIAAGPETSLHIASIIGDFLARIREHYGPDVYPEPAKP